MKKRKGDLWWVSPPELVGLLVVLISIVVLLLIGFFIYKGQYLEAILVSTAGCYLLGLALCDFLGEILGSIRDLNSVLKEQEKVDTD